MYVISSIWRHLGRHFGFFLTKSDDNNLIKWFLVPKNLCIEPTNSFLYQLFPEICYPFGGHLGRHFGFFLTKNCSNHDDNLIKWILIPKNLCIEPKNIFISQLFPEICCIQHFGGHLGRQFGFFLTKNCSNLDDNLLKLFNIPRKPMYRAKKRCFLY